MLASAHVRKCYRHRHCGISIRMFLGPIRRHTFSAEHARFRLLNHYFDCCLSKRISSRELMRPAMTFCWKQRQRSTWLWRPLWTTGTLSFLWWTNQSWVDTPICTSSFFHHRQVCCRQTFSDDLRKWKRHRKNKRICTDLLKVDFWAEFLFLFNWKRRKRRRKESEYQYQCNQFELSMCCRLYWLRCCNVTYSPDAHTQYAHRHMCCVGELVGACVCCVHAKCQRMKNEPIWMSLTLFVCDKSLHWYSI